MALRELRELGRGAFGRVFLAEDDSLGGRVAVKELLNPDADLDRLEREARVLADHLGNAHVVNIYRVDLSPPRPHIVMEYCDGGSLRPRVGKSPWSETAVILQQAAQGLLGLHTAGGFHRDLKPDNLLLARAPDGSGYLVRVADFGLARRPQTVQRPMTRTPGGTPGYMAPELAHPGAQFTAAADIYSLGIVGVELLTGQLSTNALVAAVAPEGLKNLLRRMTSPWPLLRPGAVDVVLELQRLFEPVAPAPPPPPSRPTSGGSGWFLAAGIGALALAALASGDKKTWDADVGRYRGRDGRFKR